MKYYIKNQTTKQVDGPYSVEEINTKIAVGSIARDQGWFATSDIGETIENVRVSPPGDWRPLSSVSGVTPGLSTTDGPSTSVPDTRTTGPIVGLVIGLITLLLSVWWLYTSGSEEHTSVSRSFDGRTTSYMTTIDPRPSLAATTASFIWTASFGWVLSRRLKARKTGS